MVRERRKLPTRELFITRGLSKGAREREAKFFDERLAPYMKKHHCGVERALKHVEFVRRRIDAYEAGDIDMPDEEYDDLLAEDEEGS